MKSGKLIRLSVGLVTLIACTPLCAENPSPPLELNTDCLPPVCKRPEPRFQGLEMLLGPSKIPAASEAATKARALLKRAASKGDVESVKQLLAQGVDGISINEALTLAVGDANKPETVAIIEMLFSAGADPNNRASYNTTPLQSAHQGKMIELLLAHGALLDHSNPADMMAAACTPYAGGDPVDVTEVYLRHGFDVNAVAGGETLLHCASRQNMVGYARFLLEHGAKIDARDSQNATPLCHAGSAEMVDLLLQHGAQINAQVSHAMASPIIFVMSYIYFNEQQNFHGWERLHGREQTPVSPTITARETQLEVLEALLKAGADPNQGGGLAMAVAAGDQALTMRFLAHGADVNAGPIPPLRYALSDDMRKVLIAGGATADPESFIRDDRALCQSIVERANAGHLTELELHDDVPVIPRDPYEDWRRFDDYNLDEHSLVDQGHTYYLGMDDGPRYLARIGVDGVQQLVCEFGRTGNNGKYHFRVLTDGEIIRNWVAREQRSASNYVVTHPGLRAAETLLKEARNAGGSVAFDRLPNGNRDVLSDAIDARRADVLRFWLENGVDPNIHPRPPVSSGESLLTPDLRASRTPLYSAVSNGTTGDVDLLLTYGANASKTVDEWDGLQDQKSPLVKAFVIEDPAKILALIAHGADFTHPQRFGARLEQMPEAARIVHSEGCPDPASSVDLHICLPNALKKADRDLNVAYQARLATAAPSTNVLRAEQRVWIEKRNRECGISYRWADLGGWYAYVLDDPKRATCVIGMTKARIRALEPPRS